MGLREKLKLMISRALSCPHVWFVQGSPRRGICGSSVKKKWKQFCFLRTLLMHCGCCRSSGSTKPQIIPSIAVAFPLPRNAEHFMALFHLPSQQQMVWRVNMGKLRPTVIHGSFTLFLKHSSSLPPCEELFSELKIVLCCLLSYFSTCS